MKTKAKISKYWHDATSSCTPGALHGTGGRHQLLLEHRYPAPEFGLPVLCSERFPSVRVLDLQQVIAETLQLQLQSLLFIASVLQLKSEKRIQARRRASNIEVIVM